MSAVVTGGPPPLLSVRVSGSDGPGPLPVDTTVGGTPTRVVLLDAGDTTPPAGTPIGSLIFQKGA